MKTNARGWCLAAATVALTGCAGEAGGESTATEVQALGAGEFVLLNEIELNPPGGDSPWQYIELEGTPGAILSGFQVVVAEGVGDASAQMVVDLGTACAGPCAIGSNGIFMIKAADAGAVPQGHVPPAGAGVLKDPQLSTATLTTGNTAVLLVQGNIAILEGATIARADAGTAVLPAGDTLVDGVGWGGAGALVGVTLTQTVGTPDAATRLRGRRDRAVGAWYAGNLAGVAASSVAYAAQATQHTANFPAGGALTPGAPNLPLEDDGGSADATAEATAPDGASEASTPDVVSVVDAAVPETGTADVAPETSVTVDATADRGPDVVVVLDAARDVVTPDARSDSPVTVVEGGGSDVATPGSDGAIGDSQTGTSDGAVADATGAGGAGGSVGAGGSGGATAGTGGGGAAGARVDAGKDAGADGSGDVPPAEDDGGCGCRVPGRAPTSHHGAFALFGLATWLGVRRRRNRRA